MQKLSELQRWILDYICIFLQKHHRTPSLRQISEYIGISKSRAQFHVRQLCRTRFISRPFYSRSITLVWKYDDSIAPEIAEFLPGVVAECPDFHDTLSSKSSDDLVFIMDDDFLHTTGIRKYDYVVVSKSELPVPGDFVIIKIQSRPLLRIYLPLCYPPKESMFLNRRYYNPIELPDAELVGKVVLFERTFF